MYVVLIILNLTFDFPWYKVQYIWYIQFFYQNNKCWHFRECGKIKFNYIFKLKIIFLMQYLTSFFYHTLNIIRSITYIMKFIYWFIIQYRHIRGLTSAHLTVKWYKEFHHFLCFPANNISKEKIKSHTQIICDLIWILWLQTKHFIVHFRSFMLFINYIITLFRDLL